MLAVALTEGPLLSLQSYILGLVGLVIFLLLASSVAKKINLVDINDQPRKEHIGAIPLVGGIGLFVSLIYGAFVFGVDIFYLYLLSSLLPIMIVGVIDGLQGVPVSPAYRVMAQILSSWIVIITTDVYIQDLGDIFGYGPLNFVMTPVSKYGVQFLYNNWGIFSPYNNPGYAAAGNTSSSTSSAAFSHLHNLFSEEIAEHHGFTDGSTWSSEINHYTQYFNVTDFFDPAQNS